MVKARNGQRRGLVSSPNSGKLIFQMARTRSSVLLTAALLVSVRLPASSQVARSPRITGPIDESRLARLPHNTHPLARPEFDQGPAPADLSDGSHATGFDPQRGPPAGPGGASEEPADERLSPVPQVAHAPANRSTVWSGGCRHSKDHHLAPVARFRR